jgi:hypothetical protein
MAGAFCAQEAVQHISMNGGVWGVVEVTAQDNRDIWVHMRRISHSSDARIIREQYAAALCLSHYPDPIQRYKK